MQNKLKSPQHSTVQKASITIHNVALSRQPIISRPERETATVQPASSTNSNSDGHNPLTNFEPLHHQQPIYSTAQPTSVLPGSGTHQSKVKKVLAFTLNQNLNAASGFNAQQPAHKKQEPSPATKKTVGAQQQAPRYESLQSKLKNKRRTNTGNSQQNSVVANSQIVGSNNNLSSMAGTNVNTSSNSQVKAHATAGGHHSNIQLKASAAASHASQAQSIGPQATQRAKHLKLSIDNSESSFSNITIKSADKHNSVVRTIPQTTKGSNLAPKDLNTQLTPSSNNGVNFNSSSNSLYSSHFSQNSRFTTTRPKNPTDNSSISSKNSESLSVTRGVPVLDLKKAQQQKIAKQIAITSVRETQQQQQMKQQTISEQSQNQLSQPQLSATETLSENIDDGRDISEGSHAQSQKLYQNIAQKVSEKAANASQQQPTKSKFTLVSRPLDVGTGVAQASNKDRNKKSFQFNTVNALNSNQESYRKNSIAAQNQSTNASSGGAKVSMTNGAGGMFSPKNTSAHLSSKQTQGTQKTSQKSSHIGGKAIIEKPRVAGTGSNGSKATSFAAQVASPQQSNYEGVSQGQLKSPPGHQKLLSPPRDQSGHHNPPNSKDKTNSIQPRRLQLNIHKVNEASSVEQDSSQQVNRSSYQQRSTQRQSNAIDEAILEEHFEESAQNTKRDSNSSIKQMNQKQQIPRQVNLQTQHQPQQQTIFTLAKENFKHKKGSANTHQNQSLNHSKAAVVQMNQTLDEAPLAQGLVVEDILDPPQPVILVQSTEENKMSIGSGDSSNPNLVALKEQLKSQIQQQQHVYSNPNQPSSQIEADEIQYPVTPGKALKLFHNNLTDFEKGEILDFKEIFFLGLNAQKIKGSPLLPHNNGYDDDRGDYKVVMRDHLCYRYEILDFLGKGSFGQAIKCYDYKTNSYVAVKIIRNKKRFHYQATIELKILLFLKENDPDDINNIIRVKDYAIFRNHLIISFELLSINLYEFIKNNNFQGVSLGLIRRFAIQILQALKYQRDHGVVHCDLKPENILLKQPNKSGIKIIDYGSSCFQNQRIYTYIQSRFYRAPEIVLGIPYTTAIDMWSFGCILAELYTGFPLFPGENEMEQLAYIMEIKGVPPDYILELSSRKKLFFDAENQPIIVANSRGKKRRPLSKTLKGVLKCSETSFLNFVEACLDWDPVNRMTPLEALQHDWILEGLPPKVLMHHQRMFGMKDDKQNLREATLTQIQGFPPDAENTSIFSILKNKQANFYKTCEKSREAMNLNAELQGNNLKKRNQSLKQTSFTIDATEIQVAPQPTDIQSLAAHLNQQQNKAQMQNQFATIGQMTQPLALNHTTSSSTGGGGTATGQQKKNRTIQLFMQELFDEKAPTDQDVGPESQQPHQQQQQQPQVSYQPQLPNQIFSQVSVDPQTFYGNPARQSYKSQTQTVSIQKIKEQDQLILQQQPQMQFRQTNEGSALEEDMEEGAHFSQTQKIPISLIKQQEKIGGAGPPGASQSTQQSQTHQASKQATGAGVGRSGPKLNNYLQMATQAAASNHAKIQLHTQSKKSSNTGSSFHTQHAIIRLSVANSGRNQGQQHPSN